jgi:hypothetical protein
VARALALPDVVNGEVSAEITGEKGFSRSAGEIGCTRNREGSQGLTTVLDFDEKQWQKFATPTSDFSKSRASPVLDPEISGRGKDGVLKAEFDGYLVRGVSGEGVTPAVFSFQREKEGEKSGR